MMLTLIISGVMLSAAGKKPAPGVRTWLVKAKKNRRIPLRFFCACHFARPLAVLHVMAARLGHGSSVAAPLRSFLTPFRAAAHTRLAAVHFFMYGPTMSNTKHLQPSPETKSILRDMVEEMESQTRALRAFTGLLNGHDDSSSVNVSELSYLIDPITDKLKEIEQGFYKMFYNEDFVVAKVEETAEQG